MTISTKYTRADERWSISRKHSVLADIAAGKLSALGAYPLLGITLDELNAWRISFDAYGPGGLRATHRNIIAKETRRLRKRGHVLRWHRDTEGRIISREIFAPHRAGRAVA
jgi:hypothetical protein